MAYPRWRREPKSLVLQNLEQLLCLASLSAIGASKILKAEQGASWPAALQASLACCSAHAAINLSIANCQAKLSELGMVA